MSKDEVLPLVVPSHDFPLEHWGAITQQVADWERVKKLVEACKLTIAVKNCMMFYYVHDEFSAQEILKANGVTSVQLLAKMAEDKAAEALAQLEVKE